MFIKTSPFILILLLITVFGCSCMQKGFEKLESPDGKLQIVFTLKDGKPFYSVEYDNKVVLKPSSMGFIFKDADPLIGNFKMIRTDFKKIDETWKPVWGTVQTIHNQCNELTISLRKKTSLERELQIVFRAYNDGLGFRYILPEQENLKDFEILSEETRFNFAENHSAWWIPADYDSYERLYKNTPLSEIEAVNTPITMKTKDGLYLSIHEANLTDYAGMTIKAVQDEPYAFECALVPWPDCVKVKASTPHKTPWRTIQIADNPGKLIESHLIVNLNEPCKIEDTSWIKPMKYVGIWWGMHINKYTWFAGAKHGANTKNAIRYIDFASKHGIPGLLIEGWNEGWETWFKENKQNFTQPYPDMNLKKVVSYAKKKGVKIIGHHESGGNVPDYERQIDDAFDYYEKLGIHAVKTGYAGRIIPEGQHHHGQWMVNHYRSVVQKAAEHKIMIDAHEPIKPTGIRRTWPNMMTREGVQGMEYNAWSDGNPPDHTTILPFTRMLAGPADYTPGIFNIKFDPSNKHRVYTTLAKQLALYVVLFSPLQMASDLVENYENQPAFGFIEKVPVNWDDSRALTAKIGDYVSIARKKGNDWYIGSITDENCRLLKIPLDFLDTGKNYIAHIYTDAIETDWENNPIAIEIGYYGVAHSDTLLTALSNGGGQAVQIVPATEKEIKDLKQISEFNETATKKMEAFKKGRAFSK